MRLGLALVLLFTYGPFLGWPFASTWFLSYGAMQLLELRAFSKPTAFTPNQRRLALMLLAANSLLFGAVCVVGPFQDGAWSIACLGFLLGGAILNTVTTTLGSRSAFIASLAPFAAYIALTPFVASWVGATLPHVFMIAAAGAVIIVAAVMMWRIATASELAQAEAQRSLLQARNEAEAANRAKSDFLANMSHEIRTPMNGVLGMAQAMAAGELGATQREQLDVIRQSGQTLLAILNDLLDLSKIESGKLELEKVEFHIGDLARSVRGAFSTLADQKGLSFDLVVDPSADGRWRGDPTRVRQILYNLTSNALKFTDSGGIHVIVKRSDDVLEIAVRDTGVGMSAETLDDLFERFVQADASTTRRFGGTGLGLAICRELARLMGGDISAASEIGRGSVFTVQVKPTWLGAPADSADGDEAPTQQRSNLRPLALATTSRSGGRP